MTAMTIERSSAASRTPKHQIRVSVREIRETAWRALFAAGLSAGEAASAADVITAMELHEGTGLAALDDQLRRAVPGHRPVGLRREAVTSCSRSGQYAAAPCFDFRAPICRMMRALLFGAQRSVCPWYQFVCAGV